MITTKEKPATLAQLKKIEVVKGDWLGDRWAGIQHGELVQAIHTSLDKHKIKINNEAWYPNGRFEGRLHGTMELAIPKHVPMKGTTFCLGVQHSNLGDHALKFAVGAKVFVCSNGMVTGDYAVKRKHTVGIDLQETIDNGIATYLTRISEIKVVTAKMQAIEMSRDEVDHVLMQAGREGLMSWSRIGMVDEEYSKPTFNDFKERDAWSLYNAFTFIMQKMPPHYHIAGMNRFREILIGAEAETIC